MLSRVADSIYWMSRYIERAENLARFIDVTFNLMLDSPHGSVEPWKPLVYATGDEEYFAEHYGNFTQENVLEFMTFDSDYPNSIRCCLNSARENARSVREAISSDLWEHINSFYYRVRDAATSSAVKDSPLDFLHEVKQSSNLFKGLADSTMSRGEGWNFARLGRLLERADKTSRILDVKYYLLLPTISDLGSPTDDLQWQAVLRSVSGIEMFRRQYHGITPHRVVNFLVLDRSFPRAIYYSVVEAERALHQISGTPMDSFRNPAEKHLGRLRSELAFASVDDIINFGLHEFLDMLQMKLNDVGEGIFQTFIAMRPVDSLQSAFPQHSHQQSQQQTA